MIEGVSYIRYITVFLAAALVVSIARTLVSFLSANDGMTLVVAVVIAALVEGRMHGKATGRAPERFLSFGFAIRATLLMLATNIAILVALLAARPGALASLRAGLTLEIVATALGIYLVAFLINAVLFPLGARNFVATASK